jgi:hypothetical protein
MPGMRENRFEMLIAPELLARVDEWRQRQTVPPTRAAAMRYLIERGLAEPADHPNDELRRLMGDPRKAVHVPIS